MKARVQQQIDELMQKRMDRKDFLKHVAIGTAMLTGFAGIVKVMNPSASTQTRGMGYGGSVYGGESPTAKRS